MDTDVKEECLERGWAVASETERIVSLVAEARQICGCRSCHGGYEIGERTIAYPIGDAVPSTKGTLTG